MRLIKKLNTVSLSAADLRRAPLSAHFPVSDESRDSRVLSTVATQQRPHTHTSRASTRAIHARLAHTLSCLPSFSDMSPHPYDAPNHRNFCFLPRHHLLTHTKVQKTRLMSLSAAAMTLDWTEICVRPMYPEISERGLLGASIDRCT